MALPSMPVCRVPCIWHGILVTPWSVQAIFTVVPVRFVRALYHLCIPQQHHTAGLQGQQLFDTISVFIFASAVCFLCLVNAGALYFWMKDLTQEFLKLHVIATAVEILDKVLQLKLVNNPKK